MVLLPDTSVWIEFLRGTGSPAHRELLQLVEAEPLAVVTSDPIAMELLAGPTDELSVRRVQRLVGGMRTLELSPRQDFREAAAIQRATRRNGQPIRNLVDCLIAAIAIRHEATLLHKDADVAAIAQVTELWHTDLRADA